MLILSVVYPNNKMGKFRYGHCKFYHFPSTFCNYLWFVFFKYYRHDCGVFVIKYARYLLYNDLGNMPMSFDAGNARLEIAALLFKNKQLKQIGKGSSKSDE